MDEFTVERRRSVWLALSDFYLDTELEASSLAYIRSVFEQSGFSQDEIKRINYEEVAPVLMDNLRNVAGVWGGFDEQWVLEQITSRLNRSRPYRPWRVFRWLWRKQVDYYTQSYFDVVFASD